MAQPNLTEIDKLMQKAAGKMVSLDRKHLILLKHQLEIAEKYRIVMNEIKQMSSRLEPAMKELYATIPVKDDVITKDFLNKFEDRLTEVIDVIRELSIKIDAKNRTRTRLDKLASMLLLTLSAMKDALAGKKLKTQYSTTSVMKSFDTKAFGVEGYLQTSRDIVTVLLKEVEEGERVLDQELIPKINFSIRELEDLERKEREIAAGANQAEKIA